MASSKDPKSFFAYGCFSCSAIFKVKEAEAATCPKCGSPDTVPLTRVVFDE